MIRKGIKLLFLCYLKLIKLQIQLQTTNSIILLEREHEILTHSVKCIEIVFHKLNKNEVEKIKRITFRFCFYNA